MTAKTFPLADILSITTGKLLSRNHIAGVYQILGHMTGDDLFTHQLPRAMDACAPALIEQHPFLAAVVPPAEADPTDLFAWLLSIEQEHGTERPVAPLAQWTHVNALEEAADLVGANRVWLPGAPGAEQVAPSDQMRHLGEAADDAAAAMRRFIEDAEDGEG